MNWRGGGREMNWLVEGCEVNCEYVSGHFCFLCVPSFRASFCEALCATLLLWGSSSVPCSCVPVVLGPFCANAGPFCCIRGTSLYFCVRGATGRLTHLCSFGPLTLLVHFFDRVSTYLFENIFLRSSYLWPQVSVFERLCFPVVDFVGTYSNGIRILGASVHSSVSLSILCSFTSSWSGWNLKGRLFRIRYLPSLTPFQNSLSSPDYTTDSSLSRRIPPFTTLFFLLLSPFCELLQKNIWCTPVSFCAPPFTIFAQNLVQITLSILRHVRPNSLVSFPSSFVIFFSGKKKKRMSIFR